MNHSRPGRTRPDYGVDGYPYVVGWSAAALVLGLASGILGGYGHQGLAIALAVVAPLPAVPAALG